MFTEYLLFCDSVRSNDQVSLLVAGIESSGFSAEQIALVKTKIQEEDSLLDQVIQYERDNSLAVSSTVVSLAEERRMARMRRPLVSTSSGGGL